MGKYTWLVGLVFGLFFMLPSFVHADDLNYDTTLRGFYWATTVTTPQFTNRNSGSYGITADVKFRQGSGMDNWGIGLDYTSTSNGPRFVNTGGVSTSTFQGFTGVPVATGTGIFGLVSPGTYQFGGGKIKYFFPVTDQRLGAAFYANYFVATGGLTALGGGAEASWKFNKDFNIGGFVDVSNSTGNGFPSQLLVRYQAAVGYNIPDTSLNVFVGYRSYKYSRFNVSTINGAMFGVGSHF